PAVRVWTAPAIGGTEITSSARLPTFPPRNPLMTRLPRFSLLSLLLLTCLSARADNWPQWRGPNLDGVSKDANLPVKWSATENVLWKLKLPGMGGATPVVWDDHVFVTSEDGGDIVLLCIGTDSKVKWKKAFGKATRHARTDEGNGASATPCTDG